MDKAKILAEYIRNQLEAEEVEIYLDIDDYKVILQALERVCEDTELDRITFPGSLYEWNKLSPEERNRYLYVNPK